LVLEPGLQLYIVHAVVYTASRRRLINTSRTTARLHLGPCSSTPIPTKRAWPHVVHAFRRRRATHMLPHAAGLGHVQEVSCAQGSPKPRPRAPCGAISRTAGSCSRKCSTSRARIRFFHPKNGSRPSERQTARRAVSSRFSHTTGHLQGPNRDH
jgi:hypothetical protein